MTGLARRIGALACFGVVLLAIGGCGSDSSDKAAVGDCIDGSNQVVDCGSSSAEKTLVSDQDAPDAIACIQIGDKPQVQVKVGDGTFCAEPK